MEEFLYWGQVQDFLRERAVYGEEPCSFYQAVMELWKGGLFHMAQDLPRVSFNGWDVSDLDELERLMSETPVQLSVFRPTFEAKVSAQTAVRHFRMVRGAPIRIAEHQSMGLHAQNAYRLLYVVRGQAKLATASSTNLLQENTVCVFGPDFLHDAMAEDGCLMLSVALADQTLDETLYRVLGHENILADFFRFGMGGEQSGCLLLHMKDVTQLRVIFRGLLHESYNEGLYSKNIYHSYLEILFALLLRDGGDYRMEQQRRRTAMPMMNVLRYIQDHYRDTSLEKVAERFHYDPSYLSRKIKAETGRNYTDMVRELRLNEVKTLLKETDLSMEEIAVQAGFDSRVHLFRSFRVVEGMTPGQWRKTVGQKEN